MLRNSQVRISKPVVVPRLKPMASQTHRISLNGILSPKSNEQGKNHKVSLSESSMSIILRSEQLKAKYVKVVLKSNWGHHEKLTLIALTLFGEKNQRIPILYSSTIPAIELTEDFSKLLSGNLISSAPGESWSIPFSHGYEISIVLLIANTAKIDFIRIWNDKYESSSCLREFSIVDSEGNWFEGEVLAGFGLDVYLRKSEMKSVPISHISDLFPKNKSMERYSDHHGLVPLVLASSIKIEFLSSFSGSDKAGINGIKIFDINGKQLEWDDIEYCNLGNGITKSKVSMIFGTEEGLNRTSSSKMFSFKTDWNPPPYIDILLKKPAQIAKIEIWNLNSLELQLNNGMKSAKIFLNSRCTWVGRLRIGNGGTKMIGNSITNVWFIDNFQVRRKINVK